MIALGLTHVLFTFHDYDSFSLDALWFASAGVAIVLAGFLNLVLLRQVGQDRVVWLLCVLTNVTFSIMFAAALILMRQPQVFLGLVLFALAALVALLKPQAK